MRTAVTFEIPSDLQIPTLSVCFRYVDIIDMRRFAAIHPSLDLLNKNLTARSEAIRATITVKQIFDLAPNSSLFIGCDIRFPGNYQMDQFHGTDCDSKFKIDLFYMQKYICYKFQLLSEGHYRFDEIASSLNYAGMAYTIGLNLSYFNGSDYILPMVHDGSYFPSTSKMFATQIRRFVNLPHIRTRNLFHFSNTYVTNLKLPAPYATNCSKFTKVGYCFTLCLINESTKRFNKYPFSEIVGVSSRHDQNKRIITTSDLENKTFSHELSEIEQSCGHTCRSPYCNDTLSITEILSFGFYKDALWFRVDLTKELLFLVAYLPLMKINEYSIYVMSCLGTWLGISFLQLNPIPLIRKKLRINKNRQRRSTVDNVVREPLSKIWTNSTQRSHCCLEKQHLVQEIQRLKIGLVKLSTQVNRNETTSLAK